MNWEVRPDSGPTESADHLLIQGCTADGNLILTGRRGRQALHLEMKRNSFSSQSLLAFRERFPGLPLQVNASDNVFAVDILANPVAAARGLRLDRQLRWEGRSNAYSVTTFANSSPSISRYNEWLASSEVSETNSVSIELGIKARLTNLTEHLRAAVAAAFTLTAEERQRLKAQGWTSDKPPGADPQKTGPGKPYHEWRASPAYQDWLKLVREHIPGNTNGR